MRGLLTAGWQQVPAIEVTASSKSEGTAETKSNVGENLLQHHPRRRMVACAFLAANFAVDAGLLQAAGQRGAE